jgi:hypothetical protein
MNKLQFMRLWDLYNSLLTPTQQEITNLYFNLDLTISEIAESKGITRQGVSECLASCKKQLEEYEQKLGHEKLFTQGDLQASFMMTDVKNWAEDFLKLHPEYAEDIDKLTAILDRDYEKEIKSALALEKK